jgi:RimJ/RimL family protein N-acetyltransferase
MHHLRLHTPRLLIRSFTEVDLLPIHRILDQAFGDGTRVHDRTAIEERRSWLHWAILCAEWFPRLYQPPVGERAIVLRATDELIGAVGYVPCLDVFEQVPGLCSSALPSGFTTPEIGLFWAIDPQHQRLGYASEAARAMIDHAFQQLRIKRLIATTTYTNFASQAVMRKIGMRIERNPLPNPPWLEIVGIIEHP